MGSQYTQAWSLADRRPKPAINLRGADGVDDDLPNIILEDYDMSGEKDIPSPYSFDSQASYPHCIWPESPNSLGGSEDMSSASSSPSTSNPSSNTSFNGFSFSDLHPLDLSMMGGSQSCPPSMTTSPDYSPLSEDFNYFGDTVYPPPPIHMPSVPLSPASQISMMSNTELLDNRDPIYQNVQAGTTSSSFLLPPSFQMNGHIISGDRCSDSGQAEYLSNPLEPRPPDLDRCINSRAAYWQPPFQGGDNEESFTKPSSLTTDYDQPLPRGRRCRSESDVEYRSNSVPVKTARNAPYSSRSRSKTRPEPRGGYRARVSTKASRRVSDARRTAPAPHQCHLCLDTFTRADGLQNHIDRHNGQGKKTRCDFCHEEKTTISRHMRTCAMNPDREPSKPLKK